MNEDKLIKNVIIARSGIYKYRAEEMEALGLPLSDAPEQKDVYNVYRPPIVLSMAKDRFKMLPLTNGHPSEMVDSDNFKKLVIGYTGENVNEEYNEETDEIILKTKVALLDNIAIDNYYTGIDEVSPGYLANFRWYKGKTTKGEDYDIIMSDVTNGNHLAMTPKARGGRVACIIDSVGGTMTKKYFSGLWRNIRKKLSGVKDSDLGAFRGLVNDIVINRASMPDETLTGKIEELKGMMGDLPESEDKIKLSKYLEDFAMIKNVDDNAAKTAADMVSGLYEKLDTQTMEGEKTMEGEQKPVATAAPTVQENEVPKKDEAVTVEYVLAELKKLIDNLSGGSTDSTPAQEQVPVVEEPKKDEAPYQTEPKKDEAPEEEKKKEDKPVGDSMYNITLDSEEQKRDGLTAFFNKNVKKGGR